MTHVFTNPVDRVISHDIELQKIPEKEVEHTRENLNIASYLGFIYTSHICFCQSVRTLHPKWFHNPY